MYVCMYVCMYIYIYHCTLSPTPQPLMFGTASRGAAVVDDCWEGRRLISSPVLALGRRVEDDRRLIPPKGQECFSETVEFIRGYKGYIEVSFN